ncbi:TniQ family protein [Streptomyces albicerus]|uniref:TniQ family protein n=1 Tax=Streptomyces albicerus TaxID=2569859 RepID=UPI00124B955B|nr:TniQ family protein [Streptomyces albicerus]
MSAVRSLPIRIAPVPGEALDSWLETMAHCMRTYLRDLSPALGLLPRRGNGTDLAHTARNKTVLLHPAEAEAIAAATGLEVDQVHRMTLKHYDQKALLISPEDRHVNLHAVWGRRRGSRFCPQCLSESGGRWQLSWRLGWSFACLAHNRLLADECPDCGRPQRMRQHSAYGVPVPGLCVNTNQSSGKQIRCRGDLTRADTPTWPAGASVLAAQRLLDRSIAEGRANFGIYAEDPPPTVVALADVRAVAARFLSVASRNIDVLKESGVLAGIPAQLLEDLPESDRDSRFPARPGSMTPRQASATGAAVLAALDILGQPDVQQAGERMRPLIDATSTALSIEAAVLVQHWGGDISPRLKAVHLAALRPLLTPNLQLRYRTVSSAPSRPATGVIVASRRARKVPTLLWPLWSLRLSPPQGAWEWHLRQGLSGALLMVGNRLDAGEALARLGSTTDRQRVSRTLRLLERSGSWLGVQEALVRLADYLDATAVPIDYHRRRRLDYRALLPAEQWNDLCNERGIRAGRQRRALVARALLTERLSGLPPSSPDTSSRSSFRNQMIKFPSWQTPALAEALDRTAREFLDRNNLRDEPISWLPPAELLHRLDLPGPDPEEIDVTRLHQLLRGEAPSVPAAADALGATREAVRLVLAMHPAPPTKHVPGLKSTSSGAFFFARHTLTAEELTRLYIEEKQTLLEIGRRIGVSAPIIGKLAAEYDIPLRYPREPGRLRTAHVPREWLYEQYILNQRSVTDLAAERQIGVQTMLNRIRENGIPLRERGGRSHQKTLHRDKEVQGAPPILRPAFTDGGASLRLERFAAASIYTSFIKAGRALKLHPSSLTSDACRLERDLGTQLLQRATPGAPMQLTDFGLRVVEAIRAWKANEPSGRSQ